MKNSPAFRPRLPRKLALSIAVLVFAGLLIEGILWLRFYQDASSARDALLALRSDLNVESLKKSPAEITALRDDLAAAKASTSSARDHVDRDPLLFVGRQLPFAGTQARGLSELVRAADDAAQAGLHASDVLLAYTGQEDDPHRNAIQEGIVFIEDQRTAMTAVRADLDRIEATRRRIPGGLAGPLDNGVRQLDDAIAELGQLVQGYERARDLLPDLLGFRGPRTYLVLPQNDTELFPSGGLISSYGIVTFDEGRVSSMSFEYFVNLYDRWQRISGGEYVEPPSPLKNYLLRHVSFALGEAGWYPDFPTTARLAASFVNKGGNTARLDGVIALDLQFVEALLRELGPVPVQEAGVVLTAENLSELTLQETRNELAVPGSTGKSFLGLMARDLLSRIFATSKEEWVGLLELMDRMGRERHLQMHFNDTSLYALAVEYGIGGEIKAPGGDYLLFADTSVNSTKLNLILETSIDVRIALDEAGTATTAVTYTVANPFPAWQQGRDPRLVAALMLGGVYGSYSRVYAHPDAVLLDVLLDGEPAGAEQIEKELDKSVFGRFFTVRPGETGSVTFVYRTPAVAVEERGTWTYDLYIQKEAGTRQTPLSLRFELPSGSSDAAVQIAGRKFDAAHPIVTDLAVDREIRLSFKRR